jgi:hypothetical protein
VAIPPVTAPTPTSAPPEMPAVASPPASAPPEMPAAEAAPSPAPSEDELVSPTLAELYHKQGFTEKAVEVYRQILEREPGNERLRRRVAELQGPPPTVSFQAITSPSPAPAGLAQSIASPAEPEPVGVSAGPARAEDGADTASRRAALERTIARLEGMLAAIKKG